MLHLLAIMVEAYPLVFAHSIDSVVFKDHERVLNTTGSALTTWVLTEVVRLSGLFFPAVDAEKAYNCLTVGM